MKKKGLIFLIPPKTILISQLWMFTVRKKLFFFFGKKRKDKYCSTVHRQMYAIKRNVSKNTEAV